jgi:hypothetical protein
MTVTATRATVVIGSLLRFRRYWFEVASCVMTQFCGRPPPPTGAARDVSHSNWPPRVLVAVLASSPNGRSRSARTSSGPARAVGHRFPRCTCIAG